MRTESSSGSHHQGDKRELVYRTEGRERNTRAEVVGRVSVWLERIIYLALILAFACGIAELIGFGAEPCDLRVAVLMVIAGLALAATGLVVYFVRLARPDRRGWFHLAFALLLIVVILQLLLGFAQALGAGLGDCPG